MKILILSTDAGHHRYLINYISKYFHVVGVIFETYKRVDPFERIYPFLKEEKQFNQKFWKDDISPEFPPDLPVFHIHRVNDKGFIDIITKVGDFDLGLVWGCGKIKPHVFDYFKLGLINIHRGIVQKYRGLDSEYWAIYHNDFENIGVTLHYINEELDMGDIVVQDFVSITPSTKIYHLKYLTSIMATNLVIKSLMELQNGTLQRQPQVIRGRYYSAMPTVLINLCVEKFNRHVNKKSFSDHFAGQRKPEL